ncbi:Uncharacterized protein FWK35_00037530 [Aphis craccivora]|uniref:Uncharacterized protein n=1 Tax=Aphis craccivora TaxID=307492 RepID=A0A6G0Z7M7_APHCR|nr:Uncharacterized protein FWK35_00037530 [Aphis craccivora]
MRRSEDDIISRVILNWKPMGKRPPGRPRKRWLDVVQVDLERLTEMEGSCSLGPVTLMAVHRNNHIASEKVTDE